MSSRIFHTLLLSLSALPVSVHARFDPYELNGGLVSAVAGKDYVLIASDTRLTDGGYGVLSRTHLGSRLWVAGPTPRLEPEYDTEAGEGTDDGGVGDGGVVGDDGPMTLDGSVAVPPFPESSQKESSLGRALYRYRLPDSTSASSLTFVGSAGCASDCEALKRTLRSEMTSHALWTGGAAGFGFVAGGGGGGVGTKKSGVAISPSSASAPAKSVATALMQTLYSRRPFPYYSFCVLAGLEEDSSSSSSSGAGAGRVHVYDAIGSHERVAVSCAGAAGREMLQPVLDRLFVSSSSSSKSSSSSTEPTASDEGGDDNGEASSSDGGGAVAGQATTLRRDGSSIPPESQRIGSLGLGPPVATCVECSPEEAVDRIVRAYRSVSEREIGVGDDVVVCVLRRGGTADDDEGGDEGGATLEVMRFPLKKH